MADTRFPPLKREPLLEEELPAANPTVRLIKGARIKFAPGQPTGLHRHPISTVGVVTARKLSPAAGREAGSASQNRRQLLRAGRPHDSQVRQRVGERARRDRLLLSRRHEGAPADRDARGGMDSRSATDRSRIARPAPNPESRHSLVDGTLGIARGAPTMRPRNSSERRESRPQGP